MWSLIPSPLRGCGGRSAPQRSGVLTTKRGAHALRAASLLFLTLLLPACTSAPKPPSTLQPIPILAQHHGDDPALRDPLVRLIQTRRQLEAFHADQLEAIDVNFNVHSLLLIAIGERPTSGWWSRVDHVQQIGNHLYFQGVANAPGPGQMVTQILTYPWTAIVIPRVGKVQLHAEIESTRGHPGP